MYKLILDLGITPDFISQELCNLLPNLAPVYVGSCKMDINFVVLNTFKPQQTKTNFLTVVQ